MKAREFLQDLLEGGVPAAVDGIRAEHNPRPEQAPPSGTIQDRIAGLNFFGGTTGNTQSKILTLTVIAVAALLVVKYLRK